MVKLWRRPTARKDHIEDQEAAWAMSSVRPRKVYQTILLFNNFQQENVAKFKIFEIEPATAQPHHRA